jgi:hypothetical protein
MVASLDDAVRYVNVATQTIGVYPYERKAQLRDRLASAGAQRLCRLGTANAHALGSPHDGMYPLQRFVHWMGDDDIDATYSVSARLSSGSQARSAGTQSRRSSASTDTQRSSR